MSTTARDVLRLSASTPDPDPFAALWAAPVAPLKPLGAARIIRSWEAPADLWQPHAAVERAEDIEPAAAEKPVCPKETAAPEKSAWWKLFPSR